MAGRQDARQGDGAGTGSDFHGDRPHLAAAVGLDPQPAGQRNVEPAQQQRVGRQFGQHRGLHAVDRRLEGDPAAVARIGAVEAYVDRLAALGAEEELRLGRDDDLRPHRA